MSPLAVAGLLLSGSSVIAAPATAVAGQADVSVNVLVLDNGDPMVGAIADRLAKEGVPTTRVDLNSGSRAPITADSLAYSDASGTHGNFSGVVLPSDAPAGLTADERAAINTYEAAFKVREVSAYNYANSSIGLNVPAYSGQVDGLTATVTTAAKSAGFNYLTGTFKLDDRDASVPESYGYLATPLSPDPAGGTFTPMVTAPIPGTSTAGSLAGVYNQGGRERLVLTFASNSGQAHWRVLSHGIVSWLTRGVSTSYSRNYFSVHIDDVLKEDALWSPAGNCTIGEGCDETQYPVTASSVVRMTSSDVTRAVNWQNANGGIKLDMVYNGVGKSEYLSEYNKLIDPLSLSLSLNTLSLRFTNHTWSHPWLGCVQTQNFDPWNCVTDAAGNTQYVSQATIQTEISKNKSFASSNLFGIRSAELVTGEHSGLKHLPEMPNDNPNLAAALTNQGIKWLASDASREKDPRVIGPATTVPRYPISIFYNAATKVQNTDEYNWIYNSRANGGSGLCEDRPDIMTCIAPLNVNTGFDSYIKPLEVSIATSHILDNDARPHYVHQSNLAGEAIVLPVLTDIVSGYKSTFATNTPIVNPTMTDAGTALQRQQAWGAAKSNVQSRIVGNTLVIKNTGSSATWVPITVPEGSKIGSTTFGTAYAGQRSDYRQLAAGQSVTVTIPASGYTSPATWSSTTPAAALAATSTPAIAAAKTVIATAPNTSEVELPATNTDAVNTAICTVADQECGTGQ